MLDWNALERTPIIRLEEIEPEAYLGSI